MIKGDLMCLLSLFPQLENYHFPIVQQRKLLNFSNLVATHVRHDEILETIT